MVTDIYFGCLVRVGIDHNAGRKPWANALRLISRNAVSVRFCPTYVPRRVGDRQPYRSRK